MAEELVEGVDQAVPMEVRMVVMQLEDEVVKRDRLKRTILQDLAILIKHELQPMHCRVIPWAADQVHFLKMDKDLLVPPLLLLCHCLFLLVV